MKNRIISMLLVVVMLLTSVSFAEEGITEPEVNEVQQETVLTEDSEPETGEEEESAPSDNEAQASGETEEPAETGITEDVEEPAENEAVEEIGDDAVSAESDEAAKTDENGDGDDGDNNGAATTDNTTTDGQVKVIESGVRIRKEPNTTSDVLATLYVGEKLDYIEETGDWTKIKYKNEYVYIKTEFVERVD